MGATLPDPPATLVAAGCGGAAHHAIRAGPTVYRQSGLLGGGNIANSSAGDVVGYRPTGNIGTEGFIAKTGYDVYVLSVVRETPQGESVWVSDRLLLKRGELGFVDYRHAPAAGKPLDITAGAPGGQIGIQKAQPEKSPAR
jgi:hypothetical protein